MNRHRSSPLHQIDKLGNHLLGVLVGAVHVVRASDNHGQVVGVLVSLHNELRSRFRCRIRICRVEERLLHNTILDVNDDLQTNLVLCLFSIHLIRTHMNKPLNLVEPACLQHHVRANHIIVGECETIPKRVILG